MTRQQEKRIKEMISARLPKNWEFSFLIDEDEIVLIYQSPKSSIRIIDRKSTRLNSSHRT